MSNRAFYVGVSATIVAAVILAIFTIGGPNAARQDMFDQRRYENLRQIATALHCENWRILQPELPLKLDLESIRAYCGGIEIQADVLVDNETNVPYTYTRISETMYSVCAVFHDPEKAMRLSYLGYPRWNASFNPDTGCITGRVR
jgi:hypothetical protein